MPTTRKAPTTKPTLSKAEHLHIRTSARDKKTLAHAARLRNQSVSQFMLQSALPLAEEILSTETPVVQTVFELDAEAWDTFTTLLDAPPRALPALRELLNSKPVWEA